jgi:hypothetical protein
MTTNADLKARFFIGTDPTISGTQRLPLPEAGIETHDHPSLLGKLRIAGKNLICVTPGFDGGGIENALDRVTAARFT